MECQSKAPAIEPRGTRAGRGDTAPDNADLRMHRTKAGAYQAY